MNTNHHHNFVESQQEQQQQHANSDVRIHLPNSGEPDTLEYHRKEGEAETEPGMEELSKDRTTEAKEEASAVELLC